jgi:diketogulonate reductase-like aldo/keto reductase
MLIAGKEIEGIGLGTARFAFRDRTAEDSVATVHAALDAGVMLIDTAPAVQFPPPLAQGVLAALVRPGDEAVQRHRHVAGGVRHREPPEWLRLAGGRADGSR